MGYKSFTVNLHNKDDQISKNIKIEINKQNL